MVSFDSDHSGGDGASLFFSRSVYASSPAFFWGGVWEEFFLATLLISGVVDLRGSLGSFSLRARWVSVAGVGVGFVGGLHIHSGGHNKTYEFMKYIFLITKWLVKYPKNHLLLVAILEIFQTLGEKCMFGKLCEVETSTAECVNYRENLVKNPCCQGCSERTFPSRFFPLSSSFIFSIAHIPSNHRIIRLLFVTDLC